MLKTLSLALQEASTLIESISKSKVKVWFARPFRNVLQINTSMRIDKKSSSLINQSSGENVIIVEEKGECILPKKIQRKKDTSVVKKYCLCHEQDSIHSNFHSPPSEGNVHSQTLTSVFNRLFYLGVGSWRRGPKICATDVRVAEPLPSAHLSVALIATHLQCSLY